MEASAQAACMCRDAVLMEKKIHARDGKAQLPDSDVVPRGPEEAVTATPEAAATDSPVDKVCTMLKAVTMGEGIGSLVSPRIAMEVCNN